MRKSCIIDFLMIEVAAMAQLLSESEIRDRAANLTDWQVKGSQLQLDKKFADFLEVIAFVNKLVEPAEDAGHHPDISISYNKVSIVLTTHDAGGLTQKDFDLAKIISAIQ